MYVESEAEDGAQSPRPVKLILDSARDTASQPYDLI